ncbi:multidrug effflux MFS transporter [Staphylococcus carnosus]|uniref:Bcr/CflA family efflux transporter n=1 Tax=Staphylococcus carnosus TaxID=1281 RepID=A0AAJ0JPI4_STACA|nr:multidrug effflux MFS transporter [Staphylococcus carnosus]KKB25431.1 bicyclomycin transporter TcaB [Staphylococcus carnosus]KOR12952.1 bicyclomycin transporter TcaB [Staphylococcus carnosus]PNZ97655.1 Bcr/CflA family drug resistance efflux transporter [Staphylococcus carnosus]QQS84478.1 multidrug effflux MFS transporter [Staphylococcus carnosus]QRQ04418.1 multidrug effflux MFS transporter [Staphylococcus carnosus]
MIKNEQARLPLIMIIVLGAMTAFGPMLVDMYNPALPQVQDDFGVSTSTSQLTLSFVMIGMALGQFIFGPLSDIYGRKRTVMTILILMALVSLSCVFISSIDLFLGLRFIQGLLGGGAIVIARATVGDQFDGTALTQSLAALLVVNGIITIVAPLVGGYTLAFTSWKMIFAALTIISLVIFVAAMVMMKETRSDAVARLNFGEILKDFGHLLSNAKFVVPMLMQGLTYVMLFSYAAASPFITQKIYHMTPQAFGWMYAVNGVGLILMSQVTAFAVKYISREKLLHILTAIQLTGVFLVIITTWFHLPLWLLVISFFIMVCPVTGIGPVGFALAIEERSGGSGNASSLLGLFQFILGGIIAPLVGIKGGTNVGPFIIIIVITSILVIILNIWLSKLIKKA